MARFTPTHEPPDFSDEELLPEEPAPSGRQLLRMFIPVAVAIVVFVGALLLVIKFLVIPALERGDPAAQARGVATLSALQTQQAVTRTQRALTPQPTPQPTSTPRPVATAQPASQPTVAAAAAVLPPAGQANQATTSVAVPVTAETKTSSVSTPVVQPATNAALPITGAAARAPALLATPGQVTTGTGNEPPQDPVVAAAQAAPTLDAAAQAEVLRAYQHYWEESTLALRDLDPALLDGVAVGKELSGLTSYIDDLRSQGRAIRTHVIHHVYVLSVTPQEAVITDEYEDRSIYINAITKEPLDPSVPEPQPGPIAKVRKLLQRVDGVWKVAGGQLYE